MKRWYLYPFSLGYHLGTSIRNRMFDWGLFSSSKFKTPIIGVGNLSVGGSGKSPMVMYLAEYLSKYYRTGVLSRGYGRITKGYGIVNYDSNYKLVGDEPMQLFERFRNRFVIGVCEDRVYGIQQLLPQHNLILLDDAYQHRAVKPGFSVLLFDYTHLNKPHLLLPAGNLREPFSGRWRADSIIVSKCPDMLTEEDQADLAAIVDPLPYQQLFFTAITYLDLQDMNGNVSATVIDANTTVFLLTGIANPQPLIHHLEKYTPDVIHHNYPDHHQFSLKNISKLADEFEACKSQKKVIITTEKDAQRLREQQLLSLVNQLPILVQPIGIKFLNNDGDKFDQSVKNHVREYTEHHQLH